MDSYYAAMNQFLVGNLLNIWIVQKGGRSACLIETSHYQFDMRYLKYLNKYANAIGCYANPDTS
jgi:hypothetical protein